MSNEHVCFWCHSTSSEPLESTDCDREPVAVHPSHRPLLENYCREAAAAKWRLLGGVGASIVLSVAGALLLMLPSTSFGAVTIGVATAVCGVTLLKYPFATPETLSLFGVRRSITLARAGGYVVLAMAAAVTVYGVML